MGNTQVVDHHQLNNDNDTSLALFQVKKKKTINHQVFADDICYEIISYIDDSMFIINNCTLISKQFYQVIKERVKLYLCFRRKLCEERIELFVHSPFLCNVIKIWFYPRVLYDNSINFVNELKQLTKLDISWNKIGSEGAKYISELKQLTKLDIYYNQIGSEGAKYISELKQLTKLNISSNEICDEGAKYISELKQLTKLNINLCLIHLEGCKFITKLENLKSLNIGQNQIEVKGAKFISEMKQLTKLNISYNQIGNEGCKLISEELKQAYYININEND